MTPYDPAEHGFDTSHLKNLHQFNPNDGKGHPALAALWKELTK